MAVETLKKMKLYKLLVQKEKEPDFDGKKLSSDIENTIKNIRPILATIYHIFPEYTLHDISHSERVLRYMSELMPEEVQNNLNYQELYILILSAYLHDVGMALERDEERKLYQNDDFLEFKDYKVTLNNLIEKYRNEGREEEAKKLEKDIISDFIRKDHHLRSYKFITQNYDGKGGLTINDFIHANVIARICRSHCYETNKLEDKKEFDREFAINGKFVNLQYLAICLRLADILDMGKKRTPSLLKKFINPRDFLSKRVWDEHQSVAGVAIKEEKIKVDAICKSPILQRGLLIKISEVESELKKCLDLLDKNPKEIQKKYYLTVEKVEHNVCSDGSYLYNDFQFELEKEKIMRLLMGTELYEQHDVCLRELLQNSIDACRCRKAKEAGYEGHISFEQTIEDVVGVEKNVIIVEDNGIGMDEYIIQNYFMRIGKSYYQSYDFKRERLKFSPISVFGIGILSCFMVCDKLEVETKKERKPARKIEIENVLGYFITRENPKKDIGTRIKLYLKDGIDLDIFEVIKKYAIHVEFDVKLKKGDRNEIIKDRSFEFKLSEIINPIFKPYIDDFYPYEINLSKEGVNGLSGKIVILFFKNSEGKLWPVGTKEILEILNSPMFFGELIKNFEEVQILSQDGIYVPHDFLKLNLIYPFISPKKAGILSETYCLYNINLTGNSKLDLSANRDRHLDNEHTFALAEKLNLITIKHLDSIIREKSKFSDEIKSQFIEKIINKQIATYEYEPLKNLILNHAPLFYYHNGEQHSINFADFKKTIKDYYVYSGIETDGPKEKKLEDVYKQSYVIDVSQQHHIYTLFVEELKDVTIKTIETSQEVNHSFFKISFSSESKIRKKDKETPIFDFFGDYSDIFCTRVYQYTLGFGRTVYNKNHRFTKLLFKEIDLADEYKNALYELRKDELIRRLSSIPPMGRIPLSGIQKAQKEFLDPCIEYELIRKEEYDDYILTEKDFAPYDLG